MVQTIFRALAWMLAALAVAGCSTLATGYNNAPTLLTWWADSYFDLDNAQEAQLKAKLTTLRAWHRTQLPDYARVFAEVQARLNRTVEPADMAWLYDETQRRLRRLAERAAPDAADLAMRLTPENVAALRKKLAKNNTEFEKDYITATLDQRQEKRYERLLKEAERWYGSFSREQEKKIRLMSDLLPDSYPLVLEERKRRQAALVDILNAAIDKGADREDIARRLLRWADFERDRPPAYADFARRYRAELQKMFAAVANMADTDQRETAMKNVGQYMDDFNTLASAN